MHPQARVRGLRSGRLSLARYTPTLNRNQRFPFRPLDEAADVVKTKPKPIMMGDIPAGPVCRASRYVAAAPPTAATPASPAEPSSGTDAATAGRAAPAEEAPRVCW